MLCNCNAYLCVTENLTFVSLSDDYEGRMRILLRCLIRMLIAKDTFFFLSCLMME